MSHTSLDEAYPPPSSENFLGVDLVRVDLERIDLVGVDLVRVDLERPNRSKVLSRLLVLNYMTIK